MFSPSAALTTLRPDLGSFEQFSLEANMRGMIGTQVLAPIDVKSPSGTFGKLTVAELLKITNDERASGGGYNATGTQFTSDTYITHDRGLKHQVDHRDVRKYAEYFDLEQVAAKRCRSQVMVNLEARVAAAVFNTTTWTGASLTTAIGTNWNSTGTPIADIKAARILVRANCGMEANAVIMDWELFQHVISNAEVTDLLKYNGIQDVRASRMTQQALAQILNVDRVLVARMMKQTTLEGQASTIAQVWDKTMCMVCRLANPGDPMDEVAIGRMPHWSADGSELGGAMDSWYDPNIRGDWVRCRMEVGEKIVYPEAGHLLTAVL